MGLFARMVETLTVFGFLDAPLASLLYFNQRHANGQRQNELSCGPEHRRADSLHANYRLNIARGKRSLTKRTLPSCSTQATTRKSGWWPFVSAL
jgi:hypothetical protein